VKVIIVLVLLFFGVGIANKKSPHGVKFDVDCSKCHTETDWKVDPLKMDFNHNSTNFRLDGQHTGVNCRSCHPTLVFSEAKTECSDCHQDMHNQTVGFDCERCHSTSTWIISNTRDIHQKSRFPLLGTHSTTDCAGCHPSASKLQFETLGIDCYNCHSDNYRATTTPNHIQAGYSTNCIECHNEKSYEWTAAGFNHDFFPLTKGHAITACVQCHKSGTFEKIPANCIDCHGGDYNLATNPNHVQSGFSTNCTDCHTTDPGWKPAAYKQHDSQDFPIYSGKHNNQWKDCSDCHQDAGNYSSFTCLDCHEHSKSRMDSEHRGENGYAYESNACYNCHPRGRAED
jgi:Zn finger protein HypA/HybF involved in hydrogenase expression